MKKPKSRANLEILEASIGVRTRAKTLALQKQLLQLSPAYLNLRSRTLEKVVQSPKSPRKRQRKVEGKMNSETGTRSGGELVEGDQEMSVGENDLEVEARGRSTRESTPSSFIRESVTAETPGSTTRQTSSTATNRRTQHTNPTAEEIEEFLASIEKQQHMLFAEKYNFDLVNEVPLPGCFEWVKVEN